MVPHLLLIHGACSIKHFNKIYDQMAENDNFFLKMRLFSLINQFLSFEIKFSSSLVRKMLKGEKKIFGKKKCKETFDFFLGKC